jgi:hypothetical protein
MSEEGVRKLKIQAYEKFQSGQLKTMTGSYELQLNPASVNCVFAKVDQLQEEKTTASGDVIDTKRPTYYKESIDFSFVLDHTGALPFAADGMSLNTVGTKGLKESIEKLKAATIKPLRSTHAPPFVKILWGDIALQGTIKDFSIEYTYFNVHGEPLRAKVKMGVIEVVDSVVESTKFQSPDITRMPVIKAGDSLPQLCEQFYDAPQFYIAVAQENQLASFRRLRPGQILRFPPLEK